MCYNRFLREDLKEDIELACVTEVGKLFHAEHVLGTPFAAYGRFMQIRSHIFRKSVPLNRAESSLGSQLWLHSLSGVIRSLLSKTRIPHIHYKYKVCENTPT